MPQQPRQGMPRGIPYIVGNEAAERFSYYGMKAILAVFMTEYLMMSDATATSWIHSFGTAAYFFPMIGAFISDIFLGKYKTIISLSLVYCLGHLVLALFEGTQEGLAVGLTLIAVGSGGIKPCVSSHVGDQFSKANKHLIERVFGYFYIAINVGAFLSSFLTPIFLQQFGPSIAFGVPGALMFLATLVFWLGRNKFVAIPPVGWKTYSRFLFSKAGLRSIGKLLMIYAFIAFFWALFEQTMSTWVLQAKQDLMIKNFRFGGFEWSILPDQVQSFNALMILVLTPTFSLLVYPLLNRVVTMTPLRKIGAGLFIASLSFIVIGWAEGWMEQGISMHVGWQFVAYFIITVAEVMVSITALELSYTQAPNSMKSLIMGLFWLTVSMGNFITMAVNEVIVDDVQVVALSTGKHTSMQFNTDRQELTGYKLNTDEIDGLMLLRPNTDDASKVDTIDFSGTFVLGEPSDKEVYPVLDINKEPVPTFQTAQYDKSGSFTVGINKFKGSTYFYIFSAMMAGAAVLFVFVSLFYRYETHLQEHEP